MMNPQGTLSLAKITVFLVFLFGCVLEEEEDNKPQKQTKTSQVESYEDDCDDGDCDEDEGTTRSLKGKSSKSTASKTSKKASSLSGSKSKSSKSDKKSGEGKCKPRRELCRLPEKQDKCRGGGASNTDPNSYDGMCDFIKGEMSCTMGEDTQKYLCSHLNGNAEHPDVVMAKLGAYTGWAKKQSGNLCKANPDVPGKVKKKNPKKHYYPAVSTEEDGCEGLFTQLESKSQTREVCEGLRVTRVSSYTGLFSHNSKNSNRGYEDEKERNKAIEKDMPYYKPNGDPILAWGTYDAKKYVESQKWCTFEGVEPSCEFVEEKNPCTKALDLESCENIELADESVCEWK